MAYQKVYTTNKNMKTLKFLVFSTVLASALLLLEI